MIKMSGTPGSNPPNLCTISPDTRVALEHGASLTSPWQCVEQLVSNSLEAGATSIAVRADLASNNLWLQVVDNGRGLSKEELEVVGKLHWSGFERKGRSLAALRRIAKEISITSTIQKQSGRYKTFSVRFVEGTRGDVVEDSSLKKNSSTKVTVNGFLWNRGSRRLAVGEAAELSKLKRILMAFALARPGMRMSLSKVGRQGWDHMLSIRRHSSLMGVWREALEGLGEVELAESSVEVDFQEEADVSVSGVFCGSAHGSRRLQFVSVDGIPVERGELHLAVEKVCKRAFRFQDGHNISKKFPAFVLHLHLFHNHTSRPRLEEVLVSAVASVLDEQGILELPERTPKTNKDCHASIIFTGIKPLPCGRSSSPPSKVGLDSPVPFPNLVVEPRPSEQVTKEEETAQRSRQPTAFFFTPAVQGGRTSKPVYRRRTSLIDEFSRKRKKRLIRDDHDASPSNAHSDNLAQVVQDNFSSSPKHLLCSTLQDNQLEVDENPQNNSVCSEPENQLTQLDMSHQEVFPEAIESISGACLWPLGEEKDSHRVVKPLDKGQIHVDDQKQSEVERPDVLNKPEAIDKTQPIIDTCINGQKREEYTVQPLDLSLGSDFSGRETASQKVVQPDRNESVSKSTLSENNINVVGQDGSREVGSSVGAFVSSILRSWVNPQFAAHCSPVKLRKLPGLDTQCQITCEQLKTAHFLGQVDEKFLATVCGGLLVLWDQHAVHERIRVERLLADALVEGSPCLAVKSAACQQPLIVSLPREEAALIVDGERQLLEQWGVKLAEVSQKGEIVKDDVPSSSLALSQIPQCFLSTDLARKVDLCRALLLEAASKEEESASPRLPRALYDHLASQACRGAVMFGQKIATEDCLRLLADLALCAAPFQCAHGRPSCATLHKLDS